MMPAGSSSPDYFVCPTCGCPCCIEFRGGNSFFAALSSDGEWATPMLDQDVLYTLDTCGHSLWLEDQEALSLSQLKRVWKRYHTPRQSEWLQQTDAEIFGCFRTSTPVPGVSWLSPVQGLDGWELARLREADQGDAFKRERLLCEIWWALKREQAGDPLKHRAVLAELVSLFPANRKQRLQNPPTALSALENWQEELLSAWLMEAEAWRQQGAFESAREVIAAGPGITTPLSETHTAWLQAIIEGLNAGDTQVREVKL